MKEQAKKYVEVPHFLLDMSHQMREQDGRGVSDPIWVVCYDEHITCAEGYGDFFVLVDREDNASNTELYSDVDGNTLTLVKHVQKYYSGRFNQWHAANKEEWPSIDAASIAEFIDDPCGWLNDLGIEEHEIEKLEMQRVTTEVKYCLTEVDAEAFVARKGHDYGRLYTSVRSMVFCPQMVQLRNWILSLTPPAEGEQ